MKIKIYHEGIVHVHEKLFLNEEIPIHFGSIGIRIY
jgi:hypothetical protein